MQVECIKATKLLYKRGLGQPTNLRLTRGSSALLMAKQRKSATDTTVYRRYGYKFPTRLMDGNKVLNE